MFYAIFPYKAILQRLAKAFSIPIVIPLVVDFAFAFAVLSFNTFPGAETFIGVTPFVDIPYPVGGGVTSAVLIIVMAPLGILLSYGLTRLIDSCAGSQRSAAC